MAEVLGPNELIESDWIGEKDDPIQWRSYTLGQNKKIQEIAGAALKASELLTLNLEFASTTITAAGVLLKGALNPPIILLNAVADEIDKFVSDFRNIGFYILEVGQPGMYAPAKMYDDGQWKPVQLVTKLADITTNMATAASVGLTKEFAGWAVETLGEENIYLTGAQKADYPIEISGSKADWPAGFCLTFSHDTEEECDEGHGGAGTYWIKSSWKAWNPSGNAYSEEPKPPGDKNSYAPSDSFTGLPKIRPSQAIALMVGALDDPYDKRRPQLSTSAEAGAIVLMIGIADLTKNLATIRDVIQAFLTFFGGEKQGILAGFSKINDLVKAATLNLNDPTRNTVSLKVNTVCEMIGTEKDQEILRATGLRGGSIFRGEKQEFVPAIGKHHTSGRNFLFQEGDCVVVLSPGSKQKPNLGYVSKVVTTKDGDPATYEQEPKGWGTQELEIVALNSAMAIGFRNSKGFYLQKVHYYKKDYDWIENNTGIPLSGSAHSFKWPEELTDEEAKNVNCKITLEEGEEWPKILDSGYDCTDIIECRAGGHEEWREDFRGKINVPLLKIDYPVKNRIIGKVFEPAGKPQDAPPPNFTSVKMEDLIGDFDAFFSAISGLTESMRQIGADMTKKIDEIIEYLDAKIEELEEINNALQKILKIFAEGLPATGIYALNIPVNVGGNEYLKSSLQGAADRPPDSLDFTMSMMIAFGGPGKALQELLIPSD